MMKDKPKEVKELIEIAEKLLEDVKKPKRGRNRGKLTRTRLRNILQIAMDTDVYEEFKYKFLYLVSRNTDRHEKELEKFAEDSIKIFEQKNMDMGKIRKVLEYLIMIFVSKGVL